ncbi:hypothetical protein BCR32DRAFT_292232 [Anaeromyces robustus]|uniref:Uncharacterized protein n=1 Tax=Anaeromyces robustus TaxID=1754192 RepID=A0A1Y1XCF8_9FUNG|nr:hypothetical protein BCR32DRAFT_292232 [Anaeromyces robustus]|eukprot:ORX83054.1 hypothetical protein BCR32DRAFT_292232 [Anaeromyces robustus]
MKYKIIKKILSIDIFFKILYLIFFFSLLLSESIVITTIKSNSQDELFEAVDILNTKGGTIYIDTPVINIDIKKSITLKGLNEGGIIGIQQSNGEFPRIDFKNARKINATNYGIHISGSNQFIKYLIVENAANKGIYISGNNNIIDHVIARYNNNSGIQVTHGAEYNTISYSYSYRNCDCANYGKDADGFAPKMNSRFTVFKYCFAWDNSDDGWDSYDKEGDNSIAVTYLHSACWNNGNFNVFTGKYDYDHGKELDKNMWTIQQLMESDVNFEENYKNRNFNLNNGKINGESVNSWIKEANLSMNGNGFKLGSKITPKDPSVTRTADYCVAFDHRNRGFDSNGSVNCTGSFTNCVSFNNNINYKLPYIFSNWNNNWSWGAIKKDRELFNQTLQKPNNTKEVIKEFYEIRDKIIQAVYTNKFPNDDINFDKAIKKLNGEYGNESEYNKASRIILNYFYIFNLIINLIEFGANINKRDNNGWISLHLPCEHENIVKYLI